MNEVVIPELSFNASKPVAELKKKGKNSDVYELSVDGKVFVIKDIYEPKSESLAFYPGENLNQKAANIKLFFDVVKEYVGERAWDTSFIIAKNSKNLQCIRAIQEKVYGRRLYDVRNRLGQDQINEIDRVLSDVRETLTEACNDERLKDKDYSKVINWVLNDFDYEENVFLKKDGEIVLVDLI